MICPSCHEPLNYPSGDGCAAMKLHGNGGRGMTARYGNRTIIKMFNQINALRKAIRAEGTPAIQEAWDKVEEHIDFVYAERQNES